jgi:CelD/BcsL family acetyltransferase involved in cellulose biosynthesis
VRTFRLEVVADDARFVALREEWTELLRATGVCHLFLTWEWLHTWWQHVPDGLLLRILTVRAGGELVAIAPWVLQRRALAPFTLVPTLRWIGSGEVGSDYLDIVAKPGVVPEALGTIAAHISQHGYALDLGAVPAGSSAGLLGGAVRERGWNVSRRRSDVCPFIPISGRSWDDYLGGLGSEHRYNFRRRLRRLQHDHGMRFECAETEAQRERALDSLIRLHNARWATRGGSTAFRSPRIVAFHHAISALALSRGWLRLYTLWVDDVPAAALYGFVCGGRFHFYQLGYDERFARLSVGLVTIGLTIQQAFAERLDEYDFLHGAERYKFLWSRDTHELERIELYPPELSGAVSRAITHAYRHARHFARRLLDAGRPLSGGARDIASARSSAVVPSDR